MSANIAPRRRRRNPLTCAINGMQNPLGDVSHGMPPGTMSHKNAVEAQHYAQKIAGFVGDETNLPGWAENYISRARRDLGDVGHYLSHQERRMQMLATPDEMLAVIPMPMPMPESNPGLGLVGGIILVAAVAGVGLWALSRSGQVVPVTPTTPTAQPNWMTLKGADLFPPGDEMTPAQVLLVGKIMQLDAEAVKPMLELRSAEEKAQGFDLIRETFNADMNDQDRIAVMNAIQRMVATQRMFTAVLIAEKGKAPSPENLGMVFLQITGVDPAAMKVTGNAISAVATPNIAPLPGAPGADTSWTFDLDAMAGLFQFGPQSARPDEPEAAVEIEPLQPWAVDGTGATGAMYQSDAGVFNPRNFLPEWRTLRDKGEQFGDGSDGVRELVDSWLLSREPGSDFVPSRLFLIGMTRRRDATQAKGVAVFEVTGAVPQQRTVNVKLIGPEGLRRVVGSVAIQGVPYDRFGGAVLVRSSNFGENRPLPPPPGPISGTEGNPYGNMYSHYSGGAMRNADTRCPQGQVPKTCYDAQGLIDPFRFCGCVPAKGPDRLSDDIKDPFKSRRVPTQVRTVRRINPPLQGFGAPAATAMGLQRAAFMRSMTASTNPSGDQAAALAYDRYWKNVGSWMRASIRNYIDQNCSKFMWGAPEHSFAELEGRIIYGPALKGSSSDYGLVASPLYDGVFPGKPWDKHVEAWASWVKRKMDCRDRPGKSFTRSFTSWLREVVESAPARGLPSRPPTESARPSYPSLPSPSQQICVTTSDGRRFCRTDVKKVPMTTTRNPAIVEGSSVRVAGVEGRPATEMRNEIGRFMHQMTNPSALPGPFQFATSNPAYGFGAAGRFAQRIDAFLQRAANPTAYGSSYAQALRRKIGQFDQMLANPTAGYGMIPASGFARSVGQWETMTRNPGVAPAHQRSVIMQGESSMPAAFGMPAAAQQAMMMAGGTQAMANPMGPVHQERQMFVQGMTGMPPAFGMPAATQQAMTMSGPVQVQNPGFGPVGSERRMFAQGQAQMPPAFGMPAAAQQAMMQADASRAVHPRVNPYGMRGAAIEQQVLAQHRNPAYGYQAARVADQIARRQLQSNPSAAVVNPSGPLGTRRDRFAGERSARVNAARLRNPGACCDACAEGKPCTGCASPNPGCGCSLMKA